MFFCSICDTWVLRWVAFLLMWTAIRYCRAAIFLEDYQMTNLDVLPPLGILRQVSWIRQES